MTTERDDMCADCFPAAAVGWENGEAKDGPGGAANANPVLTEPPYLEGGSAVGIMLPPGTDENIAWTREVRDAARESVTIAADQHRAVVRGADRTLAYYLRTALAHGLTVSEIVDAGDLDAKTVLRVLDPAGLR